MFQMLKSSLSDLELVFVMLKILGQFQDVRFQGVHSFVHLVGSSLGFPRFKVWILLQILIFPSIFIARGRIDQVLGVLRGRLVIGFHPALEAPLHCQVVMLVLNTSG